MASNIDEELGHRLQDEHKALLQLSQMLNTHIAALPGGDTVQWLGGLRVAYDRLYTHVERCITMKEKDGYLGTILRDHPTLARQVEAIRGEHSQLLRMGDNLRKELAAIRPADRVLIDDICARVQRFMAVVTQHEQRENMIVLFAFNQDLGSY